MNYTKYQDILGKNLGASDRKLRLCHMWTFQQDNDPKHTSKSTRKWFSENKISVSQRPSRSPENPIENTWCESKRAVHKRKPEDMKDLERFCMEECFKIPPNVFSNLIKHFRNGLRVVILARGGCTKALKH